MLLDTRIWILIGLCVAMLFTIEAIEDYVEGTWPQMRRPMSGAGVVGSARALWVAVALFVLPGLVLTILNLAILVWQNLPYANLQLLGTIFVVVGWLLFLATTIDLGGIGAYFEDVGFVAPLSLVLILAIGDLLLLITLIDIFPHNLHTLIP
ncbi:MAG TPA: hypothetical protein VFI42_20780 [Thermomicrobiaceae bacterium]|nr:hypothetical protein [Thermomicrobiaceae bacterium]